MILARFSLILCKKKNVRFHNIVIIKLEIVNMAFAFKYYNYIPKINVKLFFLVYFWMKNIQIKIYLNVYTKMI